MKNHSFGYTFFFLTLVDSTSVDKKVRVWRYDQKAVFWSVSGTK